MKNRLDRIVDECRGKHLVLDVGCVGEETQGTLYGHPLNLHQRIREVADKVVGIDIDANGLSKLPKEWDLVVADVENFKLPIKFDVIVAGELIEHLSNPGKFLECAARHLKKGGKLIITTPNLQSAYALKQKFIRRKELGETHVCGFTPALLRQLLERNGWEVVEMQLVPCERIWTITGKILTRLVPDFLQDTIFCVARRGYNKENS
jgi:SAM-dependent methyltransferase